MDWYQLVSAAKWMDWFGMNFLCAINWQKGGELFSEGGYVYQGLMSAYLSAWQQLYEMPIGYGFVIECHPNGFMM